MCLGGSVQRTSEPVGDPAQDPMFHGLTNGLNRNKKRSVSLGFTVLPWILDSFFGF